VRPLHGLGQNANIIVVKELAMEVDQFIGPGVADDFGSLLHAPSGFLLSSAQSPVLNRLAALSDAKIQPAVRDDVCHGVGFRQVQGIMQRQYAHGHAQTNPGSLASNR
jgi:hypothetical protein